MFFCIFNDSILYAAENVWDVLRSEFSLNHEATRTEVQQQIQWFIAHPGYLQKVCRQSEPYIYHIVGEIKNRKIPGELALLPMIESAYDPFAYSSVGAAGLWQIMPATGADFGLKQDWWFDGRRSIRSSTDAALNYLIYLHKFFDGNWTLAIASYDAGEGTISRAIKAVPGANNSIDFWSLSVPRETQVYVPRLLALAEIMSNPQAYNLILPEIPYLPYFEEVNIGSQIDLNHAAKLAGISYKELIKLNPGFNHWTTAPNQPFKLLIPAEKVQQFNFNLANLPTEKRVSWVMHQVQQGDSLDNIASRYHTTVNLIKQLNQLKSEEIHLNQSILIPSTNNSSQDNVSHTLATVQEAPYRNHTSQVINLIQEGTSRRVIHIVQGADTYQFLEKLYKVSTQEIQNWNNLSPSQQLHAGQQLVIWKPIKRPQPYVIQPGDSLSTIAKHHNTYVNTILSLNPGLRWDTPLRLGQQILVG